MNFIEAVKAEKDGKKVRRKIWGTENDETPLQITAGRNHFLYDDGSIYVTIMQDFLADDWEIVPEPPKTMGFVEAMAKVKEWKTVRRLHWVRSFVRKGKSGQCGIERAKTFKDDPREYCKEFIPQMGDIEATDWVVCGEQL